jgi:hypothetical protein
MFPSEFDFHKILAPRSIPFLIKLGELTEELMKYSGER